MSTTTSRPANSITDNLRNNRYSGFTSCSSGRISEPSSLSSSFGKTNNAWQSNNETWTINNLSHGALNHKSDTLRSSVESSGDSSDIHSGSSALTESSEAESWLNHPWNHLRNSSQNLQPQNNENNLPPNPQKSFSFSKVQNMTETQNTYQKSTQSTYGHRVSFSRSHLKNPGSLDSLLAPYKDVREESVKHDNNKKTTQSFLNYDKFGMEISRLPPTEGSQSKDGPVMKSAASDIELNPNNTLFGNGNVQPKLASKNIISSSIPSQSSSYTSLESSSQARQTDKHRFDLSSTTSNLGEGIESDAEDISSSSNVRSKRSHNKSTFGLHYFPSPTKTCAWNENPQIINKKELFSFQVPQDQSYNEKSFGFLERGLGSSNGTENHRCPIRSTNSYTVPSITDRYDLANTRIPRGPNNFEKRSHNGHSTYPPAYVLDNQLQNQITSYVYELPRAPLRSDQLNLACSYPILIQPYQTSQLILAHPEKQDVGTGFRSILLEDFRNYTKYNKKYELKDLYFHIVEFSGDQHGSRFIQTKLETANSEDKEQIFREIQPNALQLMTDVYGNYVIQKLFEHGNQVQKRMLAQQLKNHVMELSLQMYGCRVVQKALEHVLDDQQAKLVNELQVDILKCIKDQNGNHVVQKAIERVPSKYIQFIIDAFRGKVQTLAVHPYGCRVIQRILEFCNPYDQANILKELHECSEMLISDQYGNYVIQHVIQHGTVEDRDKIQKLISGKLLKFSKHKFASNVVERCIIYGTEEQRRQIVSLLTTTNIDGTNPLQLMMKDQFGNYVIQKLLAKLNGVEKSIFINAMKTQLPQIKRFNYGKQINVIEKLLLNSSQSSQGSQYSSSPVKTSPNSASTTSVYINVSNISSTNDIGIMDLRKTFINENNPNSEVAINIL